MIRVNNCSFTKACRAAALLTVAAFCSVSVAAERSQSGPRLERALTEGISLFQALADRWSTIVVNPLQRMQATRSLRRLSNALDDLAISKMEFGEALVAAKEHDFPRIQEQGRDLQESVRRARRELRRFFSFLPASLQEQGGAVEQQLVQDFNFKWQKLQDVVVELGVEDASLGAVRDDSRKVAERALGMKQKVDRLIVLLQGSDVTPSTVPSSQN